jgi:adenosylhomocysteine nucleosidase
MEQEISSIEELISRMSSHDVLGRTCHTGKIADIDVVTAISGYGKVAAAATTASILCRFEPRLVLFAGVAGAIAPGVEIGDIVIADRLIQYDYDASPIFSPYVIPSLGIAEIPADPDITEQLASAVDRYLRTQTTGETALGSIPSFHPESMRMHRGLIGSGDRFISDAKAAADLRRRLPDVLAVEMEGAAVAQVCAERSVPFAVFRLISDRADHDAPVDFLSFVSSVSAPLAAGIMAELFATFV